jgi:hypothetical protein
MKMFMKSLIWILGAWSLLHATDVGVVETDSYTSPTLFNEGGTTDIVNLSGTGRSDNYLENFIIKSLPDENTGRLVMGDGVTEVVVNQHLTIEEVYGLCFHPLSTFVGDASFTYVAVDNGVEGNIGTITIPVVAVETAPTTDDKENSDMPNSFGAVNILDLSGRDANGDAVNGFVIKSLPEVEEGTLYMADGTTLVTVGQELTVEDANGLQFDPEESFVGDAIFTYVAVDDEGREGNVATVILPIVAHVNVNTPLSDNKENTEMSNSLGAVNILSLSGTDADGNAVNGFIIKTLPNANAGVLYLEDGTTPVTVNQTLTLEEADGLKFDPKEDFVGDTSFNYVAVDDNGIEGNVATVTLSIVPSLANASIPITDNKRNSRPMVHTRGATDIVDLSGKDSEGNAVTSFIITALPFASQGILYMADGTTPVTVNQTLTLIEANGLKFDPTAGFVGDATFQYVAVDDNGIQGNIAVVRIPVIAEKSCTCKPYTEDVPVFSNVGMFLMVLFSVGLGLLFIRREVTEL